MHRSSCGEKREPQHKADVPSHLNSPLSGPHPSLVACPECGKRFGTHSELERHRSSAHNASLHG